MGRRHVLALLLAIQLCCAPYCPAEEDSPSESARELMAPSPTEQSARPWEASLDGVWLPKCDSANAGGKVGMSLARLKLARSYRVSGRLSLTPELAYSQLQVSSPFSARLPESLHTLSLGLRGDYRASPKLSYSMLISPGLSSDFKEIGSDDIRVRLGFTGRYNTSERLTFLAGLIYQQGYHSLSFFPILGALFRPDDYWTISLAAPLMGVSYAPSRDLKLKLGGEFYGGEYQLHEARLGAEVVRYRDFRVLGGADFTLFDHLKGEFAAGYAFAREFTFYDVFAANRPDIKVDAGIFGRAGLKMEW
jgi:hypothetical protein